MLGMFRALSAALEALAAFWRLKHRRALLDEYERIDNELADMQARVSDLRRARRDADADRLLGSITLRIALRNDLAAGLPLLGGRGADPDGPGTVHAGDTRDLGTSPGTGK